MIDDFTNSSSVVSSDTVIKGKIDFKGELLIEGKASGDILGDSLTLGPSAKVDGKIIVKAITIQGNFTGFIRSDSVRLDAGSKVTGDIEHSDISIETGADFNGKVIRISKQVKKSGENESGGDTSIYSLTDKAVAK
ncbi:polymer-forming cytoskeletal protein [Paracoccaceae bacterium]|nr:polymer-forming cytoskeletal protein [Paracoccaceae bacterium]